MLWVLKTRFLSNFFFSSLHLSFVIRFNYFLPPSFLLDEIPAMSIRERRQEQNPKNLSISYEKSYSGPLIVTHGRDDCIYDENGMFQGVYETL